MIGKTISHYKILEKLGEGGMGEIFLAEDKKLERQAALKFLSLKMTADEAARKRFEREAKAAAALNHPNIVTVYEINEFAGQIYIAMEYVEGETLQEKLCPADKHLLKQIPGETMSLEGISIEDIIDIARQVGEGLEAAHHTGIVHRDIKLQNIIVDKSHRVKILDFGLAKLKGASKITRDICRIGTIHTMSPEQARGEELDQRTDIWSLGVVLYELATGQPPFKGDNAQAVIHSILNASPLPPTEFCPHLPTELEKIIFKCLQKDRDHRYPSMQPLLSDLKKLQESLNGEKTETGVDRKKRPAARKDTERRQATVMVAEISGYHEMLEKLGSEEAVTIMNSCFEMIAALVEKYGGKIDKIMENSLIILFGVPTAIENAPKEAVNTAIEMRSHLYRFNQENNLTIPLDINTGINTGMVITAAIGTDEKKDYTIMGDTINLASQLKDLASKGQIYLGPLTYRYTKNDFEGKELKLPILKGKPGPVFELLSTKEKVYRTRFGPERMIDSEMVGRDKELDKLKLHVLKVINGQGSITSVIGEAGIGKSRLIAELKKIDDLQKVILFEGRALSIGKNLSYHPIIDSLKNWADIKEKDSETESLSKLEQAIANIHPGGAAEIFPFVTTMMGMKLMGKYAERVKGIEGEAMEKLILKNLRDLMIKCAERRPLVYITEDLHWADISSIELLESLFRLAENHPILFINILRPNYQETGERLLETLRERYGKFQIEIYLEPLDEKQCQFLIKNLLKVRGLPTGFMEDITKRAEGNPFFVEEVVRSFIDEGIVELRDGKFRITGKINSIVIPETIQDLLMARIDRLDEAARALLKEAAVIGRHFFYKILAEVTKTTEEIDNKLEYLKRIQLIRERTRLDEIEYLFKHALAQEVTYESILLKKRKALHLDVAVAIESVFSQRLHEFYGMLALHYSKGENLEKAEEYLTKAGEEALKAAASNEALNYYQEALKLYLKKHGKAANPAALANMEKNIATAFYNKGFMIEAVEHFDKVMELWGEKLTKNTINRLLNLAVNLFSIIKILYFPAKKSKKIPGPEMNDIVDVTFKRATALAFVDNYRMFVDSIGLLRKLNKLDISKVSNGPSMYIWASVLFSFSGISFKLAKILMEYPKQYIGSGSEKAVIDYKFSRMIHGLFKGEWTEELDYDEEMVDICVKRGELWIAVSYHTPSSILRTEKGDFSGAQKCIDKLQEIGEVYDHDLARLRRCLLSTRKLLKCRMLSRALQEVEAGISFAAGVRQDLNLLDFKGIKAYIQVLQGDIAGAEESLMQSRDLVSRETRITPWHISSYHLSQFLFDIYNLEKNIQDGDHIKREEFRKKARRSGRAAKKTAAKFAPNRTETLRLMGVYYWLIKKQKKALAWWHKSITVGEYLGARLELARTYMEIGKRLLEKKSKFQQLNGIQAGEYLEKARVLFLEMELQWDLDQLDKIKGQD
ncbi:MAG: protein kinase [Candidatus Aminicenantes bacterium]|nr:MAG: protein kinase [Candidatus Aminicenantes bacterium]